MNITPQEITAAITKARATGEDTQFEVYKNADETYGGHDFKLIIESITVVLDEPVEIQACIYAPTASMFIIIPPHTAAEWATATIMSALEY